MRFLKSLAFSKNHCLMWLIKYLFSENGEKNVVTINRERYRTMIEGMRCLNEMIWVF